MSDKEKSKHQQIDRQVSSFIEEVGLYSEEHINYIDKLNHVLDEMKNSANSVERKNYPSFYETVKSFEHYLKEKRITLTSHENERLSVIVSSGLNNMAKKRMAEDLIHAVKERHASEVEMKISEERKKSEIAELKKSRSFIVNWYNLFKFALEYGTITLFSHRLKAECFDRLRVNANTWFAAVKPELRKCLDQYYFYLSVLEYNSLAALYEMGDVLHNAKSVPKNLSYTWEEINDIMNRITSLYIIVAVNVKYIDSGLKKIFKDQNPGHGFWGFIGLLTDRPIVNGKAARYSYDEMISETVRGVLFSYYTTCAGVTVKTMYQLMYLSGEDGLLDGHEKQLTDEAKKDQAVRETREQGESSRISARLGEISDLAGIYREDGINLAVRIFALEAKGNLNQWNRETESRPFFRIMKVFEGLKKYVVELIKDSNNLILEYDDNFYKNYFESQPDIMKAVIDFAEFADELQGSREKEISGLRLDIDLERSAFIKRILTPDMELPNIPGARTLRETLLGMSARCYNLCMRFNDLINRYNAGVKTQSSDLTKNYDFFLNAKVQHSKIRGFEMLTNRRDTVLADVVKAGCAISQFISEQLLHPGIKAIQDEVSKLTVENAALPSADTESGLPEIKEIPVAGKTETGADAGDVYSDRITGLKNWAYFEDFILPENYDDAHLFKGGVKRHLFCMEITNLTDINRKSGNDAGDDIYRKFCHVVKDILEKERGDNIALRGHGGIVIGYITDMEAIDAVEIVHTVFRKINSMILTGEIKTFPEPVISAGVYSESPGSNAIMNMDLVKKIMIQGSAGGKGAVAFLKNPEQIITEKDLDRRGYLKEGLISIVT
ncbi:MAG TPA: diguanylate cyclase [Spirochaetota bacterium]|nr:diguanylate cyclase [Spirochaetota bacterium]HPF04926.1 diguanylate cyclase [Spirochaetota bacterium]HPJ40959.1 diguanylate cyclase [Spirochaetota bacterium]HPR37094.1 diguanylate cyclase [Spirochaetota bacterium]HRX46189.1 diguanylate cyclase [Spirochaetota bacterium]